jgi:hypothetical protein
MKQHQVQPLHYLLKDTIPLYVSWKVYARRGAYMNSMHGIRFLRHLEGRRNLAGLDADGS